MTNETPEKLDLRSHTIAEDKKQELLQLFPEIRTESGKVDFERLKLALGETVDVGRERFGMNWPGKADCFKTIQQPSMGTLLPCKEESVDFDTTENMIVEGDNLEVLKLLQKSYLGKIKMIYIDPPYNTGNDFIYPDNYTESLQTYLEYTGQVDNEGRKFSTNTEADGRFHSKWMNMMYPRLYLARNLLTEDGLVFISIDENELRNLRIICDEVYGEENFKGQISRATGTPTGQGTDRLVNEIDYILVYAKSETALFLGQPLTEEEQKIYDQQDDNGRYLTRPLRKTGGEDRREDRPSMYYPVTDPDGNEVFPVGPGGYESRWRCSKDKYLEHIENGLIEWKKANTDGIEGWKPYQKFYLEGRLKQPSNLWDDVEGNKKASRDLQSLFGERIFDNPKPCQLIQKCIQISANSDSIILDFFAGSGTTAQAVVDLNKQDGGKRKFILVQLPESTQRKDFTTIADITKERARRVIQKIRDEQAKKQPNVFDNEKTVSDLGFKVFKLSESNFKTWDSNVTKDDAGQLVEQLEAHIDHIKQGRTQEDILYEILLKSGFPLSTKIETLTLVNKTVYSIAEGAMLICLERNLTHELIKAIADKKPMRVVCLDEGFSGNDQLKTNAVQTMKAKGVTSFRTV